MSNGNCKRPANIRLLCWLIRASKRCRLHKLELRGYILLGEIEDGY